MTKETLQTIKRHLLGALKAIEEALKKTETKQTD